MVELDIENVLPSHLVLPVNKLDQWTAHDTGAHASPTLVCPR